MDNKNKQRGGSLQPAAEHEPVYKSGAIWKKNFDKNGNERKQTASAKKGEFNQPSNSKKSQKLDAEKSKSINCYPMTVGSEGYDEKVTYIIKEYIPAESFGVIYGASGSYKSFLALSLSCNIASGYGWNKSKVNQGLVFYIAGEGGIGVPRRIKAWEDEYNDGKRLQNLYVIKQPVYLIDDTSVNNLINDILSVSQKRGMEPALIVVDTLARCFAGADENSTRDMNSFIAGCDRMKAATRATIMVIHHTGKDAEKGARGSSALRAASDFEYAVKRTDDGGAFILSCTKAKDEREPEVQLFNLKIRGIMVDDEGDEITSLTPENEGIPLPEEHDKPPKGKNTSENHIAIWQSVRSRLTNDEPTTRAVIKDDLVAMGFDSTYVRKKFGGWVKKLITDGNLEERDGSLFPVANFPPNKC